MEVHVLSDKLLGKTVFREDKGELLGRMFSVVRKRTLAIAVDFKADVLSTVMIDMVPLEDRGGWKLAFVALIESAKFFALYCTTSEFIHEQVVVVVN
jgi:hypothetical protein